jgi:uncharacterized membrane protein
MPSSARKWLLPCILAYPALAIAGAVLHRPVLSLAAILVLMTVLMLPMLLSRQPLAWAIWVAGSGLMVFLGARGLLPLVLDLIPVLVNALLAWLFGHTLTGSRMPLIAHFIGVIEGPERLALPGVAPYARHLTLFWTLLMAGQAIFLLVLLACAVPGGWLDRSALPSPWHVPPFWAEGYAHLGSYLLIAIAFIGEYGFRRVHLRHVPHASLHRLALQLAVRWPQLLRGKEASS